MAAKEIQKIQDSLNLAFDGFRQGNPELAEALRVLNISYAEYLRVLAGQSEPGTSSGNSYTPA